MTKNELRFDIQAKRLSLELNDYLFRCKQITDWVIREKLETVKSIHIFVGMQPKREINTLPVIVEALRRGLDVWAPVVKKDKTLSHGRIKQIGDLNEGSFGLIQPNAESDLPEAELILVPGLGFTKEGDRLGWGKGYYDGFLSRMENCALFSGLCFHFQLLHEIPVDPWDVKMHQIITEIGSFQCGKQF